MSLYQEWLNAGSSSNNTSKPRETITTKLKKKKKNTVCTLCISLHINEIKLALFTKLGESHFHRSVNKQLQADFILSVNSWVLWFQTTNTLSSCEVGTRKFP